VVRYFRVIFIIDVSHESTDPAATTGRSPERIGPRGTSEWSSSSRERKKG